MVFQDGFQNHSQLEPPCITQHCFRNRKHHRKKNIKKIISILKSLPENIWFSLLVVVWPNWYKYRKGKGKLTE